MDNKALVLFDALSLSPPSSMLEATLKFDYACVIQNTIVEFLASYVRKVVTIPSCCYPRHRENCRDRGLSGVHENEYLYLISYY